MRSAIYAIAASALFLCSCRVNTIYDRGVDVAADNTALTQEPKRAQGSYTSFTIWLCAPSNYIFTGNLDEGFPVSADEYGLVYLADQEAGDTFELINTTTNTAVPFDIYTTEETTNTQAQIKNLRGWTLQGGNLQSISFYGHASVPYPYICIVPSSGIGTITIHNEKPTGGGPVNVLDENLDYLVSVMPNQSGTLDRLSILKGETTLTTDSVLCNVGSTSGGSDVASSIRNYTITLNTPSEIYVSSDEPYYSIVNETPWALDYCFQTLMNINGDTPTYNAQSYWTTLEYNVGQPVTFLSDYPFQIRINDNETATIATKNTDRSTLYELYGKYYITIPSTHTTDGAKIEIEGTSGTAENTLQGTFATIAMAFTALLPILQMNVIGTITIGSLLLIPFTFALISLIIKLIKK